MKKFFVSLLLLIAIFFFTGCKKDEVPVKFEPTPITTVLTTGVNNSDIMVEGVVYGVIKNGFYVADSGEGNIFVTMGSTWTPNVNVGDKVQISGQFSLINNFPQIKNADVKVISQNNTPTVVSSEGSIKSISSLSTTAKTGSYGSLVSLTATVGKNAANTYYLADDEGNNILVYSNSNIESLEEKLDTRISLKVIVHNFATSENKWQVSFAGNTSDLIDAPLTFDIIVDKALEDIQKVVPTEIYGILDLPKAHSINNYITYSWSVENNEYLIIDEDGSVTVRHDSQDQNIKLKVTISNGVESQTVDYPIISKAIVEQTVSNLLDNVPLVDMSYVIVSGTVVGIARNQSITIRSIVIQDPKTLATTTIDFANSGNYILNNSDEFKGIAVGDNICVKGQYRHSGRPTIMNVTELEKRSTNNQYQHNFADAFVLNDKESYEEFGKNYHLYLNKLVKIENPYMNFSTSTTPSDTNWVRLGYDETSGNFGHGLTSSKHYFAFLIAAQNESLGSDSWYKMFDIPLVNDPAKQFDGYFYAYALYVSDTYIAFLIPDWDCWNFSEQLIIERDLGLNIPASSEGETILLPTTHEHVTGNITWTSSKPNIIDPATGVINSVDELTEVILTASYTYNGVSITSEYIVVVIPAIELSVSEVLASDLDGHIVKVKGVIVGFSSDGNNNAARDGIIIMDNNTGKMLLVNGMSYVYTNNKYGVYADNEGNLLKIGDEVIIEAPYYKDAPAIGSGGVQTGRAHLQLSDTTKLVRVSTDNELKFNYEEAIVIDSNSSLQALADEIKYGTLVKFVGTEEAPLYIGGSSNSFPLNIKILYSNTTVAGDAKYNNVIFSLKTDTNIPNAGDKWWEEIFDIYQPFVSPSTSIPSIPCVGEIYVVITALTSTYVQMNIVDVQSSTIKQLLSNDQVGQNIVADIPTAVEAGEMTFTLPTNNKHVTGEITWTSNSPLIDLETKTISFVTKNTEVTLTASYTFEGVEYTLEHVIVILAPAKDEPLNVSELLLNGIDGTNVEVKGYFVGYQSDGNTTGLTRGIILMDKVTSETILVDGVETLGGTYGAYKNHEDTLLTIGDELVINGKYVVENSSLLMGRKSVLLSNENTIEIVESGNNFTWATEKAIVISNHEELLAFANNPQFGVLIKFVGTADDPFLFGGSSSTASAINYKFYYNKEATENNHTKYNGATFSFKKTNNQPNAGENWWEDIFGLPEAFVGPTASNPSIKKTGVIYAVLNSKTSTYYQLSLVNVSECQVNDLIS